MLRRSSVPKFKRRRSVPTRPASIILAASFLVVAGLAVVISSLGSESASALSQAREKWQETGLIHARFVDSQGRIGAEEWLDRATGNSRRVEYDNPLNRSSRYVTVRHGNRVARWSSRNPNRVFVFHTLGPNDPWSVQASELLGVKRALDAGRARLIGHRTVRGRPALIVSLAHRAASGEVALHPLALLDAKTFLPLRLSVMTSEGQAKVDIESQVVPRTLASRGMFHVSAQPYFRARHLLYDALAASVPFPVYALGKRFGDLTFAVAELQELEGNGSTPGTASELFTGYVTGDPFGEHVLTLTEQDANTQDAQARYASFRERGTPDSVRIAGSVRPVFLFGDAAQGTYFATIVDHTLIKGRAPYFSERCSRHARQASRCCFVRLHRITSPTRVF